MSGAFFFPAHVRRSSLFVVSSRKTNHMLHTPSMQWINTLILCCWSAHPLTYYCIIKRLRSETGHAKAGSYHMKARNGGSRQKEIRKEEKVKLSGINPEWLSLLAPCNPGRRKTTTKVQTKGVFVSDVLDPLEGGESRNSRWVGAEGEGRLDAELAQECLTNDLQSDSGGRC